MSENRPVSATQLNTSASTPSDQDSAATDNVSAAIATPSTAFPVTSKASLPSISAGVVLTTAPPLDLLEDDDSAAADRAETLGTNAVTPGPAGGSSTTNTRSVGEDRSEESSVFLEGKIQDLNFSFFVYFLQYYQVLPCMMISIWFTDLLSSYAFLLITF